MLLYIYANASVLQNIGQLWGRPVDPPTLNDIKVLSLDHNRHPLKVIGTNTNVRFPSSHDPDQN